MAITYRQHASAASVAASVVVPLSTSLISGNTMIGAFSLSAGASVSSVRDSLNNRWMRVGVSTSASTGAVELWYARGVQAGTASVTAVMSSADVVADVDISEFNGVYYVDPLDQWSQNYGTGASINVNTLTPRSSGDLFVAVAAGTSIISAVPSGYTDLNGYSAYLINSGSTAQSPHFTGSGGSNSWVSVGACFTAGQTGVNPRLQFPETLVQISDTTDYLSPLRGTATWTNISRYVRTMNIGPMGRQHELDRVQSTGSTFRVDNRDGSFNTWNTKSFLYNNGSGLKPMNPINVTTAWNGVIYPKFFGYVQEYVPTIGDVLNVDVDINAYDIFQILALKTLNSSIYADQVNLDGGTNLKAYYELGDSIGSYTVKDSSGNGNTGSLISDTGGTPAYGATGPFLFDSTTSLDLTNKTNLSNGGFSTVDNQTQPPSQHQPLGSAGYNWTFECWYEWTGPTPAPSVAAKGTNSSVATIPNGVLFHAASVIGVGVPLEIQIGCFTDYDGDFWTNQILLAYDGLPGTWLPSVARTSINPTSPGWHHVVVTFAIGSGMAADLYFDGQYVGQFGVSPATYFSKPQTITIGCPPVGRVGLDPDNGTNYATSAPVSMGHVALYSADLTAAQIANHYAIGTWFQSVEVGAMSGDASVARLNKMLAVVGIDPSLVLNVPYAFETALCAETNSLATTSGLNYLQTINETEGGIIFQSPNGKISAYNRAYQYLAPSSLTSMGLFSDAASVAASVASTVYRYDGHLLTIASDDLDVWNDVQAQSSKEGAALQDWGPSDSSVAAVSQTAYGPRTMQGLTGLQFEYDIDALSIAQNYGCWYNLPINRITQINVNSYANGGLNIPQILGRGLMDRITVTYNGQTPGDPFTQDSLIEQITDAVDMSGPTWSTTWSLSPYEILLSTIYLTNPGDASAQFTVAASVTVGQLTL